MAPTTYNAWDLALQRRLVVPLEGLLGIARHGAGQVIHQAQQMLGVRVAGLESPRI
jgi:hypothetical protein